MDSPIRGIVLGTDVNRLIVEASMADVARFSARDDVTLARFELAQMPWSVMPHDRLYDRHGRPVAVITSVAESMPSYDMTAFGDSHVVHAPAGYRRNINITAVAINVPRS